MKNRILRPACGLALALVCGLLQARGAFAQITEATLQGRVLDGEERALVAASVSARNDATGSTRTATTAGDGGFTLASLPPGTYTVVARAQGFKTFEQRGLALNVGRTAALDIKLEVGGVEETVEVVSGAEAVGVSREGRVADTLTQREVSGLPLPQRDVFLLPRLSAGATAIPGAANSTKLSNSPVVTVNGNRYRGNNYVLDGSMNTNPNNSGEPAIVPSIESVEEVQVQTSNFSAEFGRGNGAVINLRTMSGTNGFHGRAWEYHRDAALNARNFFATAIAAGLQQFGATSAAHIRTSLLLLAPTEGTATRSRALFIQWNADLREQSRARAPRARQRDLRESRPRALHGAGGSRYGTRATSPGRSDPDGHGAPPSTCTIRPLRPISRQIEHSFNGGLDKITGRFIGEAQKTRGDKLSTATLGQPRAACAALHGQLLQLNLGHIRSSPQRQRLALLLQMITP